MGHRAGGARLRDQARVFVSFAGPRLLLVNAAALVGTRLWLGGWTAWDGLFVGLTVLWWPFQEWWMHRYLLHLRPFEVFGREVDLLVAKTHRAHHAEPWLFSTTPLPVILVAIPVHIALWLGLAPSPSLALSGASTYACMAVAYEWTHFLTHTPYVPRSQYYRRVMRNHRLHHFKNENHWFAFTMPWIDALLGTEPDAAAVATSPTCRTLGVEHNVPRS